MYCRNCGNVLGDGQFCPACGTPKVEEQNTNSGVQAQQPVEQPVQQQPVQQQPVQQQPVQQVQTLQTKPHCAWSVDTDGKYQKRYSSSRDTEIN